jgi:hypothetical protein
VITAIIVLGSLALAAVFAAAWWWKPALRAQIEAPSERFAAAARSYDRACRTQRQNEAGASDGE